MVSLIELACSPADSFGWESTTLAGFLESRDETTHEIGRAEASGFLDTRLVSATTRLEALELIVGEKPRFFSVTSSASVANNHKSVTCSPGLVVIGERYISRLAFGSAASAVRRLMSNDAWLTVLTAEDATERDMLHEEIGENPHQRLVTMEHHGVQWGRVRWHNLEPAEARTWVSRCPQARMLHAQTAMISPQFETEIDYLFSLSQLARARWSTHATLVFRDGALRAENYPILDDPNSGLCFGRACLLGAAPGALVKFQYDDSE